MQVLDTALWAVPGTSRGQGISDIMETVGSDQLSSRISPYLHRICGADHFGLFHMANGGLGHVTSDSLDGSGLSTSRCVRYVSEKLWRKDGWMTEAADAIAASRSTIVRVDIDKVPDTELRRMMWFDIRGRLVLAGRGHNAAVCLTVLRSREQGPFSDSDVDRLHEVGDLLVAMLSRHVEIVTRSFSPGAALASVSEAENCLVAMTELPRREVEVCARLALGRSSTDIALDLSIGLESVKTYRKRAYLRLSITSERELLIWYLDLWHAYRACKSEAFVH